MAKKKTVSGERFHDRIAALVNISPKKQLEIAEELGYKQPNIITMFKQGRTKVPIGKVGQLAIALGADPAHLTRMALQEYMPETYEAIKHDLGQMLTEDEKRLLEIWREGTDNTNPRLTTATENALRSRAESNKPK